MSTITIKEPYSIPEMGTSGLRLKQELYNRPDFLEQFTEGIALYFKEITANEKISENDDTIILGGDPREGNQERITVMASILVAHGFKVVVPENGLATTPAMSHAIRELKCAGGVVLTASHNPFTDVGIKINTANGAPALADTVKRIHELQNSVTEYNTSDYDTAVSNGTITSLDIIKQYCDLLDSIFDLNDMKAKIADQKTTAAFDSMHGAAGPFARALFIDRLGLNAKMLREEPRKDLGGYDANGEAMHPEPDFDYLSELIELNNSGDYTIVGAWDSDVDRRLDGGSGFFVESADEFTIFSKYSQYINIETLFGDTIYYCRSTVTADAIDLMEESLAKSFPNKTVKTVETPTGFKWIAELGNWGVEESNGVGNPYLREKDGIFATLFLLKIILETGKTPQQLMEENWKENGRVYFTRGEVSGSENSEKAVLENILKSASEQSGKQFATLTLESAKAWDYIHPISGEVADKSAAYFLTFSDGNTVKARFSGTGSGGYTLRVYCSKFDTKYDIEKSTIVQPMKDAFDALLNAGGFSGKSKKYTDNNQPDCFA